MISTNKQLRTEARAEAGLEMYKMFNYSQGETPQEQPNRIFVSEFLISEHSLMKVLLVKVNTVVVSEFSSFSEENLHTIYSMVDFIFH